MGDGPKRTLAAMSMPDPVPVSTPASAALVALAFGCLLWAGAHMVQGLLHQGLPPMGIDASLRALRDTLGGGAAISAWLRSVLLQLALLLVLGLWLRACVASWVVARVVQVGKGGGIVKFSMRRAHLLQPRSRRALATS